MIVELRDVTSITPYMTAIEKHLAKEVFKGIEVSDEDEKLYSEFLQNVNFHVIDGHHRLLALRLLQKEPRFKKRRNEKDFEGRPLFFARV